MGSGCGKNSMAVVDRPKDVMSQVYQCQIKGGKYVPLQRLFCGRRRRSRREIAAAADTTPGVCGVPVRPLPFEKHLQQVVFVAAAPGILATDAPCSEPERNGVTRMDRRRGTQSGSGRFSNSEGRPNVLVLSRKLGEMSDAANRTCTLSQCPHTGRWCAVVQDFPYREGAYFGLVDLAIELPGCTTEAEARSLAESWGYTVEGET